MIIVLGSGLVNPQWGPGKEPLRGFWGSALTIMEQHMERRGFIIILTLAHDQEFESNLSELEGALSDSAAALQRAVNEKSEIIHIFEEKVR